MPPDQRTLQPGSLPDRPFVFTRHARNRLRRTKLTHSELEKLARLPAREQRSGNRLNLWVSWNGWLRIVLVEETNAIVVVSVIWPAREPKD